MELPRILVSCAEAARYLGKTRATVSTYIKQHRLTKRTIDGVTGILLSELVAYKNNPS